MPDDRGLTVTAYSPYQAYPGLDPAIAGPPPVHVAVAEPAPQRRATVAFRFLLAVPHLFVLYWVLVAAGVIAFIGWWGALFTGRLPQFAVTFLSGVTRWATRVHAYNFLLTDVYPPFSLDDDPAYPVRVAIPEPQRLNRAAVFFRYFIAIPAAFLTSIVGFGASTLMAFIAWLIVLVAGQLPLSFHLAYAAVVRFQTRYTCYYWMLTAAYPGELYGDKPGTVAWADQSPPAPGYGALGYGAPGHAYGTFEPAYWNPADSAPQGYDPAQGYGSLEGYGAPAPGYAAPVAYGATAGYGVRPLFQPATWLLPLTAGARKLVTTFIVLGALFLVGYIASYALIVGALVSSAVPQVSTATQLSSDYTTLSDGLDAWKQATTDCHKNLTCVTGQDGKAANLFVTFSGQLASTSVPPGSAAAAARLTADADAAAQDLTQLSMTTSVSQYEATVKSTGLPKTLDRLDPDFEALIESVFSAS
jgi:hypothetical protein